MTLGSSSFIEEDFLAALCYARGRIHDSLVTIRNVPTRSCSLRFHPVTYGCMELRGEIYVEDSDDILERRVKWVFSVFAIWVSNHRVLVAHGGSAICKCHCVGACWCLVVIEPLPNAAFWLLSAIVSIVFAFSWPQRHLQICIGAAPMKMTMSSGKGEEQ
ncbi:hypothetical protein A2U01_0008771 [Trifolium medium]|uniref:Uncharacterized protein n=1 Tax=Trifolium medium TaxID=97028 RepID=A0A392MK70_9FABA|nr:hypothetical protein [Trifolium medium]